MWLKKAFWSVKEHLSLRRNLVLQESAWEGKLSVEFIALIYLSYIQKRMEDKGLVVKYTLHELLDELDVIECFRETGCAPIRGKVLKKQEQLYLDMDLKPLQASGIATGEGCACYV